MRVPVHRLYHVVGVSEYFWRPQIRAYDWRLFEGFLLLLLLYLSVPLNCPKFDFYNL